MRRYIFQSRNIRIIKALSYFIFLLFFTVLAGEIGSRSINKLRSIRTSKLSVNNSLSKEYLVTDRPLLDLQYTRNLIASSDHNSPKYTNFKTDYIGAIFPSDINSLNPSENYTVFCGGSTTEASQVKEGLRPPDVYTKETKISSLNLGRAGQTLSECNVIIRRLLSRDNAFFKKYSYPSKIVIATSVNNLVDYARNKENSFNSSQKKRYSINLYFLENILSLYRKISRNLFFKVKLSNYEHSIIDGCCYPISDINNPLVLPRRIDWLSAQSQSEYLNYTNYQISDLRKLLSEHDYSPNDVYFTIEPDSFLIPYENLYSSEWRGIDARQLMHNYEGNIMSLKESHYILSVYNKVYEDSVRSYGFNLIKPKGIKFPTYSFYDAVHNTDIGSIYLGKIYAKFIHSTKNKNNQ